jgi:hypothetical protein
VSLRVSNSSRGTALRVPRLGVAVFLTLVWAILAVLTPSSALAAPPEKPEVLKPSSVRANVALLHGVLDPGQTGGPFETGTYEFVYRESKTECEGAGAVRTSQGLSLGDGKEEVSQEITGLTANTRYTACLIAYDEARTAQAVSAPVTFRTAIPPETPETKPASEIGVGSARLNAVLNPGSERKAEPGSYEFRYRQSATECQGEGEEKATTRTVALGEKLEAVHAEVSGLLSATRYTFCVRALNAAQPAEEVLGPPETFETTTAPPSVGAESFTGVTATEVTLSAQIDAGGVPTSYQVEYEPGRRTPVQVLPASPVPVGVQVQLTGLKPATEYHFRFIAVNRCRLTEPAHECLAEGSLEPFTMTASVGPSALGLPDNRAYELVSPVDAAEVHYPDDGSEPERNPDLAGFTSDFRAAADGDAVIYDGDPPSDGLGGNGFTGNGAGNLYHATRGADGWEARDISPALDAANANLEWETISNDASIAAFNTNYPIKAEPQGPAGCDESESSLYTYAAGGYHAVNPLCVPGELTVGISPDNSHMLLTNEGNQLYDSVGGQRHLVDVLPNGEPEPSPNATFGGYLGGNRHALGTPGSELLGNVISANDSRVFWTDLNLEVTPEDPAGSTRLFVRENDAQPQSPIGPGGECTVAADACTVQLDAAQAGASGSSSGGGLFWTATGDGSKVFFTDCSRLTADSTAVSGVGCGPSALGPEQSFTGNDLYEYNFGNPPDERLTDLTVDGNPADALGADVQGVIGATEDGSYVYFVARGVLTKGGNAEGKEPVAGGPNLYVHHAGVNTFIATLSVLDNAIPGPNRGQGNFPNSGDWRGDLGLSTAEVAPDGHSLAFVSSRSLTGQGGENMYVYDANAQRIFCASCTASGSGGANVPLSVTDTFQTRWINTEGSEVFFNSISPLVPQDTNGTQDVYEWESDGTGNCRLSAGCVSLLSTGTAVSNSFLVDSSASGSDVFFTTRALLVPRAGDENAKLYDARVDGGFPEVTLKCTGTGCQGVPPAPPAFATPASATFNGVGNFEAASPVEHVAKPRSKPEQCKRGSIKKRGRCVRKKTGRSKTGRSNKRASRRVKR